MESYCSENVSRINIENSTDQLMSGLCKESPEMCNCNGAQVPVALKNNPGYQETPVRLTGMQPVNYGKTAEPVEIKDISPAEAYELIQKNSHSPDFEILDVRTEKEYNNGHLENAILMNFFSPQFKEQLNELDRNRTYLVYCKMGGRSKIAQKRMEKLGFKTVYNIPGGKDRWIVEEIPFGSELQKIPRWSFCPFSLTLKLVTGLKKSLSARSRLHHSASCKNLTGHC
ncbi:MAG: rhodanese-like domain-containing protein [Deltaproteobacteria bacterium]|nr:rhodanese-like domain-containing protein [Deltaproteobacteria bacterium]